MVSSESLDEKDVGVIVGANQLPENEDERRLAEMGHVVSTFPLLPNLKGNGILNCFPSRAATTRQKFWSVCDHQFRACDDQLLRRW